MKFWAEKVPVASSGRQAFSFFPNTKKNFFNFHLLASFIENGSQKKNLFTFHWSFVRHTYPPCNNETFSFAFHGPPVQASKTRMSLDSIEKFCSPKSTPELKHMSSTTRREKNFPFCYSCQLLCVGCEKFAEWFMRSSSADNKSSAKLFCVGGWLMKRQKVFL